MNKGILTTLISDIALIAGGLYTGATISNDIYVQTAIAGGAVTIALLDIKYPEYIANFRKVLDILNKINEQSMNETQEETVASKPASDEIIDEEKDIA